MPTYEYICPECGYSIDIVHSMSDMSSRPCPECSCKSMNKQIGIGYLASKGFKPTLEDLRESDHGKKVHDKDRAIKMRKRTFGHEAVGDPVDTPDPKHIVKKGKVLSGQDKEIDKQEFIKAAARDPATVKLAADALKKHSQS